MKKIYGLLCMFGGLCMLAIALPASADTGTGDLGTGSLVPYIQAQETTIMGLFDSGYASVYNELSKTGLSILKTLDYQSLVCLGVLPVESVLSQMQKDKLTLRTSLTRDFSELENKANALEEKKALQANNTVDLFDGSSYEEQRALLGSLITTTVTNDRGFIQAYESGYRAKIRQFIIDYAQYGTQNKDLVKNLSTRIAKVQYVISGFKVVEDQVSTMYNAMGVSDITSRYEGLKTTALAGLGALLDPVIALKLKLNTSLTALSGELAVQKQAMLNQYKLDMDEYFNKAFQKRYDRAKYIALKNKITDFTQKYFSNQRLNCTNVISSNDDANILTLIQDISSVSANISSGVAAVASSGSQATIKTMLIDGFKNIFNTRVLKAKVVSFQKGIQSVIQNLLQNKPADQTTNSGSVVSSGVTSTEYELPAGFTFNRTLTFNKSYPEVTVLQKLLANMGLYKGAIGTVFTQATKDAVYAYQLQAGILTSKSKTSLRGLFGPATRASLNKLLAK